MSNTELTIGTMTNTQATYIIRQRNYADGYDHTAKCVHSAIIAK